MEEVTIKDFNKILKKENLENRNFYQELGCNCYRVYDAQIPEVNLSVDIYDKMVRVTNYDQELIEKDEILSAIKSSLYKNDEDIIWVDKKKRVDKEQHDIIDEKQTKIWVKEFSNELLVDLSTKVDTGLFLDQVLARNMIREISENKRVLNLFSYTGAFSIAASKSFATEVVSVDLSNTYNNWAKENYERNNISVSLNPIINMDIREYLKMAEEKNEKFDIVILDPPSFSNSNKAENFDVQKDYLELLDLIRKIVNIGSVVYFSTNLKSFQIKEKDINGYELFNLKNQNLAKGFIKKNKTFMSWILTAVKIKKEKNVKKKGKILKRKSSYLYEKYSFDKKDKENIGYKDYKKSNRDNRDFSNYGSFESRNPSDAKSERRYKGDKSEDRRNHFKDDRRFNDRRSQDRREDRGNFKDDRNFSDRRDSNERRSFDRPRRNSNRFNDGDSRRDFDRNNHRSFKDNRESRDFNDRRSQDRREDRGNFRDDRNFSNRRDSNERRSFDRPRRNSNRFNDGDSRRDFDRNNNRNFRNNKEDRDFNDRRPRGEDFRENRSFSNRRDSSRRGFDSQSKDNHRGERSFSSRRDGGLKEYKPRNFDKKDERIKPYSPYSKKNK